MKQFLYISLVCGVIAGAGVFSICHNILHFVIPRVVAILGIISAIITIKDKDLSGLLKLGGIMINLMPLLGSLLALIKLMHREYLELLIMDSECSLLATY